jgi:hypothetical protein
MSDLLATAMMLVQTSEGFRPAVTRSIQSSDLKAIAEHVRKGGTTAGFSLTYAVNPTTKSVVCVIKKGHLVQRDLRGLVTNGFSEWHYSYAWSSKTWRFSDGTEVKAQDLDLIKDKDIAPWARAFGY